MVGDTERNRLLNNTEFRAIKASSHQIEAFSFTLGHFGPKQVLLLHVQPGVKAVSLY